jgi:uncharacterized protein YhfF
MDLPTIDFGLTPEDKDETAGAVVAGRKRATTSLHAAFALEGEPLPELGRRYVVLDGRQRRVAVIEVTQVDIRRYADVDAAFAAIEGEGDGSLAHWRRIHDHYFAVESARLGLPWSEQERVVLEHFRLVERLPAAIG